MSDELATGLAASANEPAADSTPSTPDAVLDAAFDEPSEGAAPSEPSGSPEPAQEPGAATSQPQEPAKPETQPGEPPRERWDTILANARTKAKEEALAEHKNALEIFQSLQRDLPGTLAQLLEEAAQDERFSDTITAKAAALLNARKQKGKLDEEPAADLQTNDGALVYSADQLRKWHEWNNRQIEKRLGEQFKPLTELSQQFATAEERAKATQEANSVAEKRGALWKQMPHFEANKDAILKRQGELYTEAAQQHGFDAVNGPWELLQRAYAEVVTTQALPKLQAQQTNTLIAEAAKKRAGSSGDPAAMPPAQPRKPRTVDEALDQGFSYSGA